MIYNYFVIFCFCFLLFTFYFYLFNMGVANKRPRGRNYSVDQKGAKSGAKVKNAIVSFQKLLKRVDFEGDTKWLINAKKFALAKLKKYGIKVK